MLSPFAFRRQLSRFSRQTGVPISTEARRLLFNIMSAMTEDPHPAWDHLDRMRVAELQTQLQRGELHEMLMRILEAEHVAGQLTSFDLLHWLSRNLNNLCPVDKR